MSEKMNYLMKKKMLKHNIGLGAARVNWINPSGRINLEKVFQEEWNKENRPRPGINCGQGILQDLFIRDADYAKDFDAPDRDDSPSKLRLWPSGYVYKITPREHRIVATIIQWLGCNCGFAFLRHCLNRAGYSLRETEKLTTNMPIKEIAEKIPELSMKQLEEELTKLNDTKSKIWMGKDTQSNPAKVINTIKKIDKKINEQNHRATMECTKLILKDLNNLSFKEIQESLIKTDKLWNRDKETTIAVTNIREKLFARKKQISNNRKMFYLNGIS